jgi:NitT/TauT family transport system substrate-binding protein
MYLAEELGFFRQAGLQVEFHPVPESVQMLPLLAGGRIEVGCNVPTPGFINAVLKGARLRLVASRDIASPACGGGGTLFASRKTFPHGLRDLRLLKGKRVAIVSRASITAFILGTLLASAGLTMDDVQLVTMRVPEAFAALMAGKIDAIPAVNLDKDLDYVSTSVVRSISLSEVLPNFQHSFVIFGHALLDGDPEIGTAFLWAYLRGVQEFRAGKSPRALVELARAAHSDPAAARAACRENISADGRIDRASVQRFVDWAAKERLVPQAPDAARLIETRFVEEACRRLGQPVASTHFSPRRQSNAYS